MKILINIITILILFITMPISNASDTKDESNKETMLEQQEEFGVGEFIDSAKEYTNDFNTPCA